MFDNSENKVKIRFKFRSGEEFEAEGNPDFIEKQRSDFLLLIGKDGTRATTRRNTATPTEVAPATEQALSQTSNTPSEPFLDAEQPAAYRRTSTRSPYAPGGGAFQPSENWPRNGGMNQTISAAERQALRQTPYSNGNSTDIQLWESIVRTDDKLVYLRRKSRQLSADTAALVLIAAAKTLLRATDGYSALSLSKSLKKSGYGGERLDRVLAGEMRQGTVRSEGTKRSRTYLLTEKGFARAYVLATKLADEWQS